MRQSDIGVASEEALDGNVEESTDGKIYLWKKFYSFWKHFKKALKNNIILLWNPVSSIKRSVKDF